MVAGYELMVVTPAISNLIRENKTYRIDSSDIQTGKQARHVPDGRQPVPTSGKKGLVEKEECLMRAQRPTELAAKVAQAERGEDTDRRRMRHDEDEG